MERSKATNIVHQMMVKIDEGAPLLRSMQITARIGTVVSMPRFYGAPRLTSIRLSCVTPLVYPGTSDTRYAIVQSLTIHEAQLAISIQLIFISSFPNLRELTLEYWFFQENLTTATQVCGSTVHVFPHLETLNLKWDSSCDLHLCWMLARLQTPGLKSLSLSGTGLGGDHAGESNNLLTDFIARSGCAQRTFACQSLLPDAIPELIKILSMLPAIEELKIPAEEDLMLALTRNNDSVDAKQEICPQLRSITLLDFRVKEEDALNAAIAMTLSRRWDGQLHRETNSLGRNGRAELQTVHLMTSMFGSREALNRFSLNPGIARCIEGGLEIWRGEVTDTK